MTKFQILLLIISTLLTACNAETSSKNHNQTISKESKKIEPYSCRNGFFPASEEIHLAHIKIAPNARSYFYDDGEKCPYQSSCKQKAYIINGDELLVAQQQDGWSCVWYQGKRHEFVGWMKSKNIVLDSTPPATLQSWIGEWRYYNSDSFIEISKFKNQQLKISGEAIWHGAYNNTHSGYIDGIAKPSGNQLTLIDNKEDFSCRATMRLIGKYLAVYDNHECGGMNVNFDNIYLKKSPKKGKPHRK